MESVLNAPRGADFLPCLMLRCRAENGRRLRVLRGSENGSKRFVDQIERIQPCAQKNDLSIL